MIRLRHDREYRSLIQIWIVMSNLTSEKAKVMFMKKYRQQKHVKKSIDAIKTTKSNNKRNSKSACKNCDKSHSNLCWNTHSESTSDWFKKKKNEKKRSEIKSTHWMTKSKKLNLIRWFIQISNQTSMKITTSNQMKALIVDFASQNINVQERIFRFKKSLIVSRYWSQFHM